MIPKIEWDEFATEHGQTAIARLPRKVWSRATGFAPAAVTCRVEPNRGGSLPIRVIFEIDWIYPSKRDLIVETGQDFEQLKDRAFALLIRALTDDAAAALKLRSARTQIITFESRKDLYQAIEAGRYFIGKKNGSVRKVVEFIDDENLLWCDDVAAFTCSRSHLASWSAAQVLEPEQMGEIEVAYRAYQTMERNLLIRIGHVARNDYVRREKEHSSNSGGVPAFRPMG
ncbi:hypothetical protein [Bosea sp. RAC05]|uniref:hypothetical protein n=1 Tax=Bosea sp. RAC05 TaxID=1842539 RepID=UPI00083CFF6E|nr:hypothetical protein [Bosea sp. RAC05]AOG03450.1 hypothetical protein BSY19_5159 [Bosea sp. RAC05]